MNTQDQQQPNSDFQSNTPNQSPAPQPAHKQHVSDELAVMQPGEEKIFELQRHPAGILITYTGIAIALGLAAIVLLVLLPSSSDSAEVSRLAYGLFAIVALCGLLFALVNTVVYWGNRWILTSDSLTQINRISLFGRQSAQLALVNVEDVTAEQNGLLAHIFGFGTLSAQTAAEHGKFVFIYAPNPNYYAQQVLKTKESLTPKPHGQ